jgi:hypothetical protein
VHSTRAGGCGARDMAAATRALAAAAGGTGLVVNIKKWQVRDRPRSLAPHNSRHPPDVFVPTFWPNFSCSDLTRVVAYPPPQAVGTWTWNAGDKDDVCGKAVTDTARRIIQRTFTSLLELNGIP